MEESKKMEEEILGKDGPEMQVKETPDSSESLEAERILAAQTTTQAMSRTRKQSNTTENIRDLERRNRELLVRIRELELERVVSAKQEENEDKAPAVVDWEDEPKTEGESTPFSDGDVNKTFSASPLRFAMHALFYFVGKASDMVVSLYCRAFRLENECLADFNKTTGIGYAKHGHWEKAIPLLEKALVVTPGDLDVRMYLVEAYSGVNKYENACEHLEKVLEKNPKSIRAVRTLGMIYSHKQDYDRAIEYLEKAGELDPDHAKTFYRLGAAYDNKKQHKQAIECFKKTIKLDPRFAKAYQALGFTYESMGDRESAVECFKKALELE